MKVKPDTIDPQTIKDIIVDIREYLRYGEEYRTNQIGIGMKQLFRGYIIKVSTGTNFQSNDYRKCN